MPLTKHFKETVMKRAQTDPKFRYELLREAINAFLADDVDLAKSLLRDYINATIHFDNLAKKLNKNTKSLQRMLGPQGNPSSRSLFAIIHQLQKTEGIKLDVRIH